MKKIALVTGGNSGIGYATAKLLKEKDYEVFISGRDANRLQQSANELGVKSILADMSNPDDVTKLAANFLESGLNVLVNNAAIGKFFPVGAFTLDDFSELFNTNVRGPLFLIQALLPALEKRQGSISNISSLSTRKGLPGAFLYGATKGAVNAFTQNLAIDLSPKKIRVNAIELGPIDTPMHTKLGLTKEESEELMKLVSQKIPMQRYGNPEEVAHVIVAQLESTYVSGAVWVVDGGVSVV